MKEYFEIGQIVNTNGLKGVLKVKPFTDNIKRFEELKSIYIQKKQELVEFKIEYVRYVKQMVLLKLEGINTIEEAEKYRNLYLQIKREDAGKLAEDSYYIADILECEVFTQEGELLGKVDDVFPTGSNDVYVVKDKIGKQILLPAIKSVIRQIDVQNKKIIVNLIEGLV